MAFEMTPSGHQMGFEEVGVVVFFICDQ